MRLLSRLLTAVLVSAALTAQAQLVKDLRRDFGAVGDGRTDDQPAFARAAAFFNERAKTPAGARPAELRIPAGTYRVGRPGPADVPPLLPLTACRHLTITGADSARTVIRYADSLRYGSFDPATGRPYEAPTAFFTDRAYAHSPSAAIALYSCADVTVRDLALDGNSPHLLPGGHWGDTGIQLGHTGLFIYNSRRVRLLRLAVHHFGCDGAQVMSQLTKALDDPAREDVVLENSRFDYNGRQGLSITGAHGLQARNCSFSHTGRAVLTATGRPLFSNPGAGVDVEPEVAPVTDVLLADCRLVDNAGQGLVSDRYGDGPPLTARIVLRGCLLWGTTNWSVWLRQPGFLFERCRLYGAFEHGCYARGPGWATRFVGCTFADRPYHGQPAYGTVLVDSDHEARGMSFEGCRFEASHGGLLRAVPATTDSAGRFQLRDCTLVLNQPAPPLTGPDLLAGAELSGEVTITAGPQRADSVAATLNLGAAGQPQAAVLQPGARLRLLAPGCRVALPGGLRLAPGAQVEIGPGATLELPTPAAQAPGPGLRVAPGASLLVQPGGTLQLAPGTLLRVAGRVEVAPGGRLLEAAGAHVELAGQGRVVRPGQQRP